MLNFYIKVFVFLLGVYLGIQGGNYLINNDESVINLSDNPSYNEWFLKNYNNKLKRTSVKWDTIRYDINFKHKSVIESEFLYKEIPITCIILLRNYKNEKAIRDTWGKGCNVIEFIKIKPHKIILLKKNEQESTWISLCHILNNINLTDWIFIISDYTFVIMENLRYYIAPLKPENKYYLGHGVSFWSTRFNIKKTGIVLSKGTVNEFRKHYNKCASFKYQNREDFYLGKSLAKIGIQLNDTRDYYGFSRFIPFNLNVIVSGGEEPKYTNLFPFKCCSRNLITFQGIEADKMYFYYYLLYKLQIFNHGKLGNVPNLQTNDDKVWKSFLNNRNISNTKITSDEYYKLWVQFIEDPTFFVSKMKQQFES